MWQRSWLRTLSRDNLFLPAAAAGLFLGRVSSEWLQPGLPGALLLTVAALFLAGVLWPRLPVALRGTTLPLLLYVFYPHPDPRLALAVLALALLPAWQVAVRPRAALVRLLPLFIFVLATGLYLATLAPGVLPADSGELQLVSATLGVAHPPGFALYTLLGHLFSRLPLGDSPAHNVNLLSALVSAATVTVVYVAVFRQTGQVGSALLAAAALATATTFWSQATTANVRSLTAFFAAVALALLLEIGRARQRAQRRDRLIILLALTLGLGITHHASLVFMGVIFLLTLFWMDPALLRQPRRWWRPALAASLGLLPLLYFPLRAGADVPGATPGLATLSGFLEHVLARGFSGDFFYFNTPATLWPRLQVMGNVLTFQFEPLLLAGMLLGLLSLLWRERSLAFLLGGSFLAHTLVTATYRAPQTVEYMLPAYIPAVLCLGMATAGGWPRPARRLHPGSVRRLVLGALLVVAGWQAVQRFPSFAQLHQDGDTVAYVEQLLADAPPDSLLLADWHWATPLWYTQQVVAMRPDVEVRYVFPTAEPYAVTWARRIAEAHAAGQPVVATHFDRSAYAALPPPRPLGEAFLFPQEPLSELPSGYQALDLALGDRIELRGYRIEPDAVETTQQATVTLAWRPGSAYQSASTLFAHLVGPDGILYTQADETAVAQADGISLTRLSLTPPPGAAPGAYTLLAGAYETGTGAPLPAGSGEARNELGTVRVLARRWPPATENPRYRPLLTEERQLVGYDWDNTLPSAPRLYLHWRTPAGYVSEIEDNPTLPVALPPSAGPWGIPGRLLLDLEPAQQYVPLGQGIVWRGATPLPQPLSPEGGRLTIDNHFAASRPVLRDLVVSTRLVGYEEDGFHWAWTDLHDSVPALGAIPTLKWIGGSRVRDPHLLTVEAGASPGQTVGGIVTLYDAFTGRTLPILDERIREDFLGLPLETTVVAPQ